MFTITITLSPQQREVNLQALHTYIQNLLTLERESTYSGIVHDRINTAQSIIDLLSEPSS